jgi:hypothetical protein
VAALGNAPKAPVVCLADLDLAEVERLVARFGARLMRVRPGAPIPGSYWGDSEAGLIGNAVYARDDTPVHSLLHELGHYVCMDEARRASLATDAGGTDLEECGVCYLQLLLSRELTGFGVRRCLKDMDAWGYSFREGAARAWVEGDGAEARAWLAAEGLITPDGEPTFRLHR